MLLFQDSGKRNWKKFRYLEQLLMICDGILTVVLVKWHDREINGQKFS
jgi:hypothetical protein